MRDSLIIITRLAASALFIINFEWLSMPETARRWNLYESIR